MLHAWQQIHGTPGKRNHHNAELRRKAATLGLVIDRRGVTSYAAESPFKELLRHFGLAVLALRTSSLSRGGLASKAKLKKWSCGCTNVRVAIADFRARCLKCRSRVLPEQFQPIFL